MSQHDENIYGAEDFERYHSGKMSEREMHAIEKAALDDPFLSDALEGYMNTSTALTDINELKNKLLQKESRKKVIWLKRKTTNTFLRIAAIFILISGFAWILYENNFLKKNEVAENRIKEKTVTPVNSTPGPVLADTIKGFITSTTQPKSNKQETIPLQQSTSTASGKPITPAFQNDSYREQTSAAAIRDNTNVADTISLNGNLNNVLAGKVAGVNVTNLVSLRGRVTDNNGNPVPFANIYDKINKTGVVTGKEGEFNYVTVDSVPKVEISAAGYQPVTRELNKDYANNIILKETDKGLNEVVVTSAFGIKRASAKASSRSQAYETGYRVTVTNAIPSNGWQQFYQYVNDSLKTIAQLQPGSVSTDVAITFTVDDIGKPVNIHAKKSICKPCNEEAIHLISNSSGWKLNNNRKKVNVTVRF